MKVEVERYVKQVRDGSHYEGHVKIAETKFDYELVFAVPISQLDEMEPVKDKSEIRNHFQLTIKKDNANIELTDREYSFFFSMLVEFAVDFYNNPQTRDSNEGMLGDMVRGEGPIVVIGASASIGITSSGPCDFQPQLCELLNGPKFGCALVA